MTTELHARVPALLASHVQLTMIALLAAITISLPLAIVVAERPRLAIPILTIAGVIQTVPGLALLALMVPLLAETGGLGLGVSSFGFAPAVIALTLYAILPILRNAVIGLRGVDPAVIEAARGMGMAPAQILQRVRLPLAAPTIAGGIRTAAVWTVGAATLATPVGQPSLGNFIFAGLQTRNWEMLVLGVVVAAALAVVLDVLLAATERALSGRPRRRVWIPATALAVLVVLVSAVLPSLTAHDAPRRAGSTLRAASGRPAVTTVRLGAKTFTEQYVLVEVLRARLAQVGIGVEVVESLGSTVIFDALRQGDLDAYVDYSGTIWTNYMTRDPGVPRWQLLAEVEAWLAREHGVRSLGSLGFENTYALAVRHETAERLGLASLAELARHAPALAIGGDYEFFSRREWASVRDVYGLRFARTASFDPALLYEALTSGEVDVISAFSSDGRIAANRLVVLEDPAGALPPYDAMLLLGPRVADDPRVTCALLPLRGALRVELVREANSMVDRPDLKASPAAAAEWLLGQLDLRDACRMAP